MTLQDVLAAVAFQERELHLIRTTAAPALALLQTCGRRRPFDDTAGAPRG
jgi:hypothetical protein